MKTRKTKKEKSEKQLNWMHQLTKMQYWVIENYTNANKDHKMDIYLPLSVKQNNTAGLF